MASYANQTQSRSGPRTALRPLLLASLVAFALGAALAAFLAWRFGLLDDAALTRASPSETALRMAPAQPRPAALVPSPSGTSPPAATISRITEQQGGLEQRLAAAEQRLARLDLQAAAASGEAARAEALLIAFAARRAIDRGAPLGPLADQLLVRFGDLSPNAVRTVIDGAGRPVTLDRLITRLDGLRPALSTRPGEVSLASLRSELASLFVVRRSTTPGIQPAQRLERARLFLQSGRVDAAIAEVRNLPGAANGQQWIADAQRYAGVQNALDLLETSALVEPRRLRDADGGAVRQPGPLSRGS